MEIPPPTHYARRDGASIAFQVFGEGPALVMAPPAPSHLDLMWVDPGYTQILRRLGSFARTVSFDARGVGLSDPLDHVPTVEESAADLEAVMDAAGVERAVLTGAGWTCPPVMVFAARAPERVAGLVLWGPYAVGTLAVEDLSTVVGYDEHVHSRLGAIDDALQHHWGEGRTIEIVAPSIATDRLKRGWGMLERAAAPPAMIRAVNEASRRIDLRDVLPTIRVPTIVVGREDSYQSRGIAGHVADLIPGAEFEWHPPALPGSGVDGFFSPLVDAAERMVTGGRTTQRASRMLVTVLFTDIVGSTERASAMGDGAWRNLLERHTELLHERVERAGGRVVDTTGDGALSAFDGPARAIACAADLLDASRDLGLELRAGVHTGECEAVGENLAGLAVHIGARVGALAGPGEVLVSRTVKDLVVGSGLEFAPHGTHELKGVPGTWEVFALADGDSPHVPVPAEPTLLRQSDRLMLAAARHAPGLLRMAGRLASGSR
jgi:class 3 adenylate cyclase/pimeloyl-ACP methyl ester carboxylesterase